MPHHVVVGHASHSRKPGWCRCRTPHLRVGRAVQLHWLHNHKGQWGRVILLGSSLASPNSNTTTHMPVALKHGTRAILPWLAIPLTERKWAVLMEHVAPHCGRPCISFAQALPVPLSHVAPSGRPCRTIAQTPKSQKANGLVLLYSVAPRRRPSNNAITPMPMALKLGTRMILP